MHRLRGMLVLRLEVQDCVSRQGGPSDLPAVDQLVFKNAYTDIARILLIVHEKAKAGMKQISALKSSLERVETERDDAARRAEIEAMKAEDITGRLKSAKAVEDRFEGEKAALWMAKAQLDHEKLELAEAHAKEAARLRESRVLEVTRERARVTATMSRRLIFGLSASVIERVPSRSTTMPDAITAKPSALGYVWNFF
ncbi:unnamed protein product [Eruca vesicaria subsp. sativa]|uniref:Uncharacterized protein n=1 Tax=Eruca vesicaria subsp. sativa TaxID=29727 RepID=A0ABC8JSY0_ERUVS|nr:unnamed protein product [Eruca vesicaria subsp. sativa]